MRERGRLIEIQESRGLFELDMAGGCRNCEIKHQCMSVGPGKRQLWLAIEGFDLKTGDEVEIETSSGSLLSAAFMVFLLPLIIAISIYIACMYFFSHSGIALAGLFGGFALAYGIVACIDRFYGKKKRFEPVIAGVVSKDES